MFATLLVCAMSLQTPQVEPAAWVEDRVDPRRPTAVAFTGTVELTPAEAFESAREQADTGMRMQLERAAQTLASQPFWLPDFVANAVRERWLDRQACLYEVEVVDRSDVIRDHGFGKSFQTHLLVANVEPSKSEQRRLSRSMRDAGYLFLAKCGGTVALWFLLALAFWWVDRLSRGYMSGRLRLLAVGAGLVIPGVAFLFV